jgi:hypothetical protein
MVGDGRVVAGWEGDEDAVLELKIYHVKHFVYFCSRKL